MRIKIGLLIGILAVIASAPLTGIGQGKPPKPDPEKWELASTAFDRAGDGITMYFFRKNSIIAIAPNTYKFWLRVNEFENKKWQPGYRLVLFEADCKLHRSRLKQYLVYDDQDNLDDKKSREDIPLAKWEDVIPDTAFEKVFEGVCRRAALIGPPK